MFSKQLTFYISFLLVRDTTLMPPVPGLTGILAMLFCPTLEFRTDPARSQYTGCVSGLGTDPNTGYSVYPDHDMEVVFETLFSQGDIEEVLMEYTLGW